MRAGEASATAKIIAASTVLLAGRPLGRSLVPAGADSLCRHFLSTCRADRCLRDSVSSPWTRWLWLGLERLTHPGIVRHYHLRKRWIEELCLSAIRHGIRRVIVIGAGLDTLALRRAWLHPEVAWIEIDHPDTQDLKRRGLAQAGLRVPENLSLLSVDLTVNALPPALMQYDRPTLVIIEGVLMYLKEDAVASLLRDQIRFLSSAEVQVIFSYMARWPQGRAGFRPASWWVDCWLAWRREPFRWTASPLLLEAWLKELSFELLYHAEPPFLHEDVGSRHPLKGENLAMCISRARTDARA